MAHENFWGYKHGTSMRFQHCPNGYCVTAAKPKPSSVNTCMPNRAGRLCGRCQPGYSEALFSAVCVPDSQCGPSWLLPLALAFGLFYALFLLFQPDLKQFLFSPPHGDHILIARWRHATHMNGKAEMRCEDAGRDDGTTASLWADVDEEEDRGRVARKTPTAVVANGEARPIDDADDTVFRTTDCGSGFLIILFYYFQDALLLKVKTVAMTTEGKRERQVKSVLFGLFKLQFELIEFIDGVCAAPGMTSVPKTMTKALIVPYIIVIFATMYAIYRWTRLCRWRRRSPAAASEARAPDQKSVTARLASGFILALMFMFQKMGTTTFTLLNCVPVENRRVLFIDGTVTCYQYWQYAVMAYAVACVTPFFIVLLVGPPLLQRGQIGLWQFFAGCLFPLPLSAYWVGKWAFGRRRRLRRWRPLREDERAVVNLLQGPFRDPPRDGVCWAGVLIGRRLVLVLLFTFVNDSLVRLLLMLLACFLILLHHVHVQPYKDARANVAATASAAALVALGSINLVRAGFEAAEYTPSGPNAVLMKIFLDIENALLLWLPVGVLSLLILLLLFRIAVWVGGHVLRTRGAGREREEDVIQLN
ncbi:hypothetical protein NP493_499g02012 [Ridgeia piscesae]|uniref:Uncharacterized protein n=1 Tax=Ridgeia piscesae TaxID=27915 RepID=A0AAD9KXT8_RIDPI|nr:hypothetical protein NP493_499g02012 [Ridgeia piscesae]